MKFKVKLTPEILNPVNPTLLEEGSSKRRLVMVDSEAFRFFGAQIKEYFFSNSIEAKIVSIDTSEEKKDMETLTFILSVIENFGILRRSEPIIAIGGGVLLDIVGFAASVFRRGVPYIKVPTTLLSIVDASVGIKTSINHFGRRNRLGSYYPPVAAYLDKSFLSTLPSSEIHQAMGEIIKIATIKNKKLFALLEEHVEEVMNEKFLVDKENAQAKRAAEEIIFYSIDDMIAELEPNLWETNLARAVDFGHSFSPILEMDSLADTTVHSLSHGEAVALDVIFSSCLSVSRNLMKKEDLEKVVLLSKKCRLPVYHPYFENRLLLWEALLDTMKHRNNSQHLPVPTQIGGFVFLNDVELTDIDDAVCIYKETTQ